MPSLCSSAVHHRLKSQAFYDPASLQPQAVHQRQQRSQMSGQQSGHGSWSKHLSLAHHSSSCRRAVWAYILGIHGSLGPCVPVCLQASTSLQACSHVLPAGLPAPTILHACGQDMSLRDPGTAGFALDGILAHVLRQARLGTDLRVALHLVHYPLRICRHSRQSGQRLRHKTTNCHC